MANTYTQLYIHIVFAVAERQHLLQKTNHEEIQKFITGIVQNHDHKMLAVGCATDHMYLFVGLNPAQSISDLVRDVKANTSRFINEKRWFYGKFSWQSGYGAFSYSRSHIDNVSKYVLNQEEHHRKKTFKEEYLEMLEKFGVEFNREYLFEFFE
ncbi:MAG: IS200/IS605 family transposase [Planctomycetes bacterium]|nr:IS200/IS605 family transposase [Planctomycetota bacterium]